MFTHAALLVIAAASFSTTRSNLLTDSCSQASALSVRVVNENGLCEAHWQCDEREFAVLCKYGLCFCFHEQGSYYGQTPYKACDTLILQECYAR